MFFLIYFIFNIKCKVNSKKRVHLRDDFFKCEIVTTRENVPCFFPLLMCSWFISAQWFGFNLCRICCSFTRLSWASFPMFTSLAPNESALPYHGLAETKQSCFVKFCTNVCMMHIFQIVPLGHLRSKQMHLHFLHLPLPWDQ